LKEPKHIVGPRNAKRTWEWSWRNGWEVIKHTSWQSRYFGRWFLSV